jgi:tol-pal system protein YbgF
MTMKYPPFSFVLASLLCVLFVVPVSADPALEGRLSRLERILENQSGSDLVLQMQRLRTEMQDLRGMLESQKLEIDKLQRQQRDQYLDIDSRLGAVRPADQSTVPNGSTVIANPRPTLPEGVIDASGGGLAPETQESVDAAVPVAAPTPATPGSIGVPSLPAPETVGGNERDAYSEAFELLKDRKYDEAKIALSDLLRRYPQGQYTDNARYWLGETHYMQRDYVAALAEFERLIQLSPKNPKVPSAMLKMGYIQYDQKAFDQARASLEKVISDYPTSTEARLAKSRLERIKQESP